MNWMNTGDVELRKDSRGKKNALESLRTRRIQTNKGKGNSSHRGRKRIKDPNPQKTTTLTQQDKKLKKDYELALPLTF